MGAQPRRSDNPANNFVAVKHLTANGPTADIEWAAMLTAAERGQLTAQRIGYLTANGPAGNVNWGWMFDPMSFCPAGCDYANPATASLLAILRFLVQKLVQGDEK